MAPLDHEKNMIMQSCEKALRNYMHKPIKSELDIALWQRPSIPAESWRQAPTRVSEMRNSAANQYVGSLRLLVLEVSVEGLEVLVEEAGIVVPGDAATEEVAREIRLQQHQLRLLASIFWWAEGDVPTGERHTRHQSLVRFLAELRRLGSAKERSPWVDKSGIRVCPDRSILRADWHAERLATASIPVRRGEAQPSLSLVLPFGTSTITQLWSVLAPWRPALQTV